MADRNQDDRDRWEYTATERLGYETFDDTIIWVEPQIGWRRYSNRPDDLGFFRNSVGYQVLFGATYDATSITAFEGGIGYMWRNYEDARLPSSGGIAAKALATWNATDLLTLTGKVERTIKEQIQANTGGELDTTVSLRADYEFLYNTIFNASVARQWATTDASGGTPSTRDLYWTVSLGMRHLINEYATVRLGWTLSTRDSSVIGGGFDQNLIFARLELFI